MDGFSEPTGYGLLWAAHQGRSSLGMPLSRMASTMRKRVTPKMSGNVMYASFTEFSRRSTHRRVRKYTAEEMMPVKMGDRNQEMTTGVKPVRKGNCGEGGG